MKRFSIKIFVALSTFLIGITAFIIWLNPFPVQFESKQFPQKNCSLSPKQYKITDLEAVELAECFVIANGYTAYPPTEDKSKIQFRYHDDSRFPEEVLKRRHNLLLSKAYGIKYEAKTNEWKVIFRLNVKDEKYIIFNSETFEQLKEIGQVASMDAFGGNIEVEHEQFQLNEFRPIEEITR
jgi:hypothetical protein